MPSVITPCGGGGGGIKFVTYPQDGKWLYIATTDAASAPHAGYGIELRSADKLGVFTDGDIFMDTANGAVTIEADNHAINLTADTTDVNVFANRNLNLEGDTSVAINSPGGVGVVSPIVNIGSGTLRVTTPASSALELDTTGAHFTIPSGDIFVLVDGGGNEILKVDNTTGTPSYHILTGATWQADL